MGRAGDKSKGRKKGMFCPPAFKKISSPMATVKLMSTRKQLKVGLVSRLRQVGHDDDQVKTIKACNQ